MGSVIRRNSEPATFISTYNVTARDADALNDRLFFGQTGIGGIDVELSNGSRWPGQLHHQSFRWNFHPQW